MTSITEHTTLSELAVIVSEALAAAGIPAVLGGGAAVTYYSDSRYMSTDLDFITTERNKVIAPVVARLGFRQRGKDFVHDDSKFFLEFPPGPISFGNRYVDVSETQIVETRFGELRIITPTQCVMDRLAWFVHGNDPQARAQAALVARLQPIDWGVVHDWAQEEGIDASVIEDARQAAGTDDSEV